MKEIGGYIELERNFLPMLHEGAVALNCGSNCLAYLIRARNIRTLRIPYFLCDCVEETCRKEGTAFRFYRICNDFTPAPDIRLDDGEWLYVVNFYGQLTADQIRDLKHRYDRVIVDNAQAYFDMPLEGVDTLYTCRKFFGVPDGAFLYTDAKLQEALPRDESFDRMHFLLGRFEQPASNFYSEYAANNDALSDEPIKTMSRLTDNLLRGIDYDRVKRIRTENYRYLHSRLKEINRLDVREIDGAFAYPLLLENGAEIRKKLQQEKIYIPTLWPNVVRDGSLEDNYAMNILPLPCDQRYGREEMDIVANRIFQYLGGASGSPRSFEFRRNLCGK